MLRNRWILAVALSSIASDDASAAKSVGGEKKKKKKKNSYQQDVVVSDRKSALTGVCRESETLCGSAMMPNTLQPTALWCVIGNQQQLHQVVYSSASGG